MRDTEPRFTASDTTRRTVLRTLGIGTTALLGVGSLAGSAAAWERSDIDFKGCSEVWIIVAPSDIDPEIYDPPTVAHVIVATADGDLECRLQEFTPETTTTIPGRYGDAPVLKYAPPSGEKVLGVIVYNYSDSTDRFERNSPLALNPHRCANTPGTPDATDAPCAENTYLTTRDIVDGPGRGQDGEPGHNQNGESDRNRAGESEYSTDRAEPPTTRNVAAQTRGTSGHSPNR